MSVSRSAGVSLALLAATIDDSPLAADLAGQLALPLAPMGTDPATCKDFDVLLLVSGGLLALQQTFRLAAGSQTGELKRVPKTVTRKPARRSPGGALPGPVTVDFGSEAMRHRRRSGHNELLGRAVGVSGGRRPHVLDATAGLGRDSFVLADMGCAVTLCEREPVIAVMLAQGLEMANASADGWLPEVVERMSLCAADARSLSLQQLASVDVIYLDPMFPQRDKSAAVKKEMALFQVLLDRGAGQQDADELLLWALAQDVARVVVKRPSRAPCLGGHQPSHSVTGKAVRFDVYVRRALN